MAYPEKKSNTGAVVAGSLAAIGFIGAIFGVATAGGKKQVKSGLGRPPVRRVRVRGKGCGR